MQQISGQFSGGPGFVLLDQVASNNAQWSSGQTLTTPVTDQPSLMRPWTIYGWSITYTGWTATPAAEGVLPYSVYGDLWGGLLINSTLTSTQAASGKPSPAARAQLPNDLSTFAKLYDGRTDQPFPIFDSVVMAQPVQAPRGLTYMLPAPLEMVSGQSLAMALVLTPSLLKGGMTLNVATASWAIFYEFT